MNWILLERMEKGQSLTHTHTHTRTNTHHPHVSAQIGRIRACWCRPLACDCVRGGIWVANSIWTGEPILRCQYSPHYQCSLLKQGGGGEGGREGGSKRRTERQFWKMPGNWLIEAIETGKRKNTHTRQREYDTYVAQTIGVGRHLQMWKNCAKKVCQNGSTQPVLKRHHWRERKRDRERESEKGPFSIQATWCLSGITKSLLEMLGICAHQKNMKVYKRKEKAMHYVLKVKSW